MRVMRRRLVGVVILVSVLVACAGPRGLVGSGEALNALGLQFVQTGNLYDRLLEQKLITVDRYRIWARFARDFQFAYPKAVEMWRLAVQAEDPASERALEEVILSLKSQLVVYVLEGAAYLKAKGGGP